MRALLTTTVLLSFTTCLLACNSVKGSCDRRADNHTCEEILASTIKGSAQSNCPDDPISHVKGTWAAGPCDHKDAIAACQDNLSRTWYYPGGSVQKPAHVAKRCSDSSGKLLDANGKALKDVVPEEAGPESDDKLIALVKSMGAPLESRVAAMEKLRLPTAPHGPVHAGAGKHITAHAAVVDDGDVISLTDLDSHQSPFPMPDGEQLRVCAAAVRKSKMGERDPKKQKEILTWCSTLEYLLIVRTAHMDFPKGYNGLNFEGGTVKGDVLVYELPSGKALGGYAFHAESSKTVQSDAIDSDFATNYQQALMEGLAKSDHGSSLKITITPKH